MSEKTSPKMSRRQALLIAWLYIPFVVGFLLYLMWEWYAEPDALWQHLVWGLLYVLTPVLAFGYVMYKLIRSFLAKEAAE